jgi:hypothetical protein
MNFNNRISRIIMKEMRKEKWQSAEDFPGAECPVI